MENVFERKVKILKGKLKEKSKVNIYSLPGSSKVLLGKYFKGPILFLLDDIKKASILKEEGENILKALNIDKKVVFLNPEKDYEKLSALNEILETPLEKLILITTPEALLEEYIDVLNLPSLELEKGKEYDYEDIKRKLVELGYKYVKEDAEEGEFSILGDSIVLYTPDGKKILLSFFDKELETIKLDEKEIDKIKIFPNYLRLLKEKEKISLFDMLDNPLIVVIEPLKVLKKIPTLNYHIGIYEHKIENALEFPVKLGPKIDNFSLLDLEKYKNYKIFIRYINEKTYEKLKDTFPKNTIFSYGLSLGSFIDESHKILFLCEDTYKDILKEKKSISDLEIGDYIVHKDFGIGIYKGVVNKEIGGKNLDFILIEYAQGDKLYVPFFQVDKLYPYTGFQAPKIDRLGSSSWQNLKRQVTASLIEFAKKLSESYKKRKSVLGYSFKLSKDEEKILKEFEKKFPYEETPDQKKAILEVYKDMDESYPMNRLLVGDVGFGKTEVAMRAAMKAVLKGKQVAIIAPTTVLAEQHYRNFKERFKDFPVKIELLSRFVPRKKQKEILEKLKNGKVDIIIGTHRLLQDDIKFKDLGLLIIDEEHKFGVAAKEKLASLYPHIDILYMSATPIPRTLYMGLSGFRDISIIETPPKGRRGVKTYVYRFSEDKFLKAIEKELKRGGQVFIVCNDIDVLPKIKKFLEEHFKDKKIEVLHGQMKASQIEKIMHEFLEKKIDILVSTVIIESGIDIPSANTLIVLDAHKMGLSQLYQLRGRVGRGDKKGYVYLFIPKKEKLNSESLQRLEAIKEMPELGGGLKLALKDLEIRGAGTVLGPKQSGFINKLGLDFYMELFREVLNEEEEKDVNINIQAEAYIPENYISDTQERIEIYSAISKAKDEKSLKEILNEIEKSYGKLPDPVINTFKILEIKNLAKKLKIKDITLTPNKTLIITPYKDTNINSEYLVKLAKEGEVQITPDGKIYKKNIKSLEDITLFLKKLLKNSLENIN